MVQYQFSLQKDSHAKKIYVSDIDEDKVKRLSFGPQVEICKADVFELSHIQDNSIDSIITDPPWGLWENIPDIEDFYNRMFVSFKRVLKPNGKMTILTARTVEFENAVKKAGLTIKDSLHTLVNGKKATLYGL